jgi:hypothetical protein
MRKREPRFNVDPETGELVEIDEELSATIEEAWRHQSAENRFPGKSFASAGRSRSSTDSYNLIVLRYRRSAAQHLNNSVPTAHAVGYVDIAAPRLQARG